MGSTHHLNLQTCESFVNGLGMSCVVFTENSQISRRAIADWSCCLETSPLKGAIMALTHSDRTTGRRTQRIAAACLSIALLFTSCSVAEGAATNSAEGESASTIVIEGQVVSTTALSDVAMSEVAMSEGAVSEVALFDSSVVHDIEIGFDQDVYDEMIEIFTTTGEKEWIEATITVDGTTLPRSVCVSKATRRCLV